VAQHSFRDRVIPVIARLVDLARAGRGGEGLLVALSGGPDSVALLLTAVGWAKRTGSSLAAAHLNHQLRSAAADADEEFCRELTERLGVPLTVERADPRHLARKRGMGLEEAGRHLRRRFWHEVLEADGTLTCAATGHHRDDLTETVIMRFFRGTGPDGLAGIEPVSGRIIHPLLDFSGQEILAFLESEGQPYRLDTTNESFDFTRVRVRRELLPLARGIFGASADTAPARLADLLAQEKTFWATLTRHTLARLAVEDPPPAAGSVPVTLAVAPLLDLDRALARRVVRLALRPGGGIALDLGRTHVDELLAWLPQSRSGSSVDLPHGWRVVREFDRVRFVPPTAGDDEPGAGPLPLSSAGSYRILVQKAGEAVGSTQVGARGGAQEGAGPAPRWTLDCPADAVCGQLSLRPWRQGDRIALLGLDGHKKLSDLLRERRIGVTERSGVLVVTDDEGILWVVGLARAERTRVLPTTEAMVTIAVVAAAE